MLSMKSAVHVAPFHRREFRNGTCGQGVVEAARLDGWALHFADLDIDTSTQGEMAANIIISGSQY